MTEPRRPATLGDVAQLAGVSQSTVSNVVRGADVVAVPTRVRVEAAIERLGYRPNVLARQLLTGRATTIGIIARDLTNPFIAEMAALVEREVARHGFATMFSATDGVPAGERRAVELMSGYRPSGVVFLSYLRRPTATRTRVEGRFPTVFVAAEASWSDSVTVDERHAGQLVAGHLVALGHERLAFFSPRRPDHADDLRLDGFMRALAARGLRAGVIAWDPPDGVPTIDGAPIEWPEVLVGPGHPTAIFAANDFAAIDLLDVADSLGIRVPEELSIVGFDDVEMARLRRISLTTVGQPRGRLVRLGVERLLDRIAGRVTGPPALTQVPVELKLRGSTGPPG
jgi:LacI family transcriptional regulator